MYPVFENTAELKAFSLSVLTLIPTDPSFRNPLSIGKMKNFFDSKIANEDLASEGEHSGPAIYIKSFLDKVSSIVDDLNKATEDVEDLDEEEEYDKYKKALFSAYEKLSDLFKDPYSPENPARAMYDYLERYGASQLTYVQIQTVCKIINCFENAYNAIEHEKDHQMHADCKNDLIDIVTKKKAISDKETSFIVGCSEVGLTSAELFDKEKAYKKEVEDIENDIKELENSSALNKNLENEAKKKIRENQKKLSTMEKQIGEAEKRKQLLDDLVIEMKDWDEEVDVFIETENRNVKTTEENNLRIAELNKLIEENQKSVEAFKKDQNELKKMLSDKSFQAKVKEYNDTMDRYRTLSNAIAEFELIKHEDTDINELLHDDVEDPNVKMRLKSSNELLQRYYRARQDIVHTLFTKQADKDFLEKQFQTMIE